MSNCGHKTEIFSRVVGFYSALQNWNKGKKEEFKMRKKFKVNHLDKTEEVKNIPVKEEV